MKSIKVTKMFLNAIISTGKGSTKNNSAILFTFFAIGFPSLLFAIGFQSLL